MCYDPLDEFEEHIRGELLHSLGEIRENLLEEYGFYFNFCDVYLKHPNEKTIEIY